MIDEYLESWYSFKAVCEKKVKDRCTINSDGWSKLREFHLDKYLNNLENPYSFLFTIKWKHRNLYNSHRMARYYYKYLRERTAGLDPQVMGVVEYPSWRKNVHRQ